MKIVKMKPVMIFLHENVPGFPDKEMERILGTYMLWG